MGERWQDIEVSGRGKWDPAIEGESEKKKGVWEEIVIQREAKDGAKIHVANKSREHYLKMGCEKIQKQTLNKANLVPIWRCKLEIKIMLYQ